MESKINRNTAFYLKYRPQSLTDLIGQEQIKKILSGAISQGRLSHAYLFAGPRGTGKTSTARILAKMVNCESQDNVILGTNEVRTPESNNKDSGRASLARMTSGVPCNKCPACVSITDGSNLDLIEIDAASNRGIEDIRALREKIKLSPSSARKKVYIIDEVHMLTAEAFNALLKTLEEPPAHVLFILATTDVSKLPQTILSRVQRLDFKLASKEDLLQTLTKIIASEKIEIDEYALSLIVNRADGSFRDAVKFLDQLASIGKKITIDDAAFGLAAVMFESAVDILEKLIERNPKEAILLIQESLEKGADVKQLMVELINLTRKILLIKHDLGPALVQKEYPADKYDNLKKLADKFEDYCLTQGLKSLQEGLEMMKFASIPSLPLELAVLEICDESVKCRVQSVKSEEQTSFSVILSETKDIKKLDSSPAKPDQNDTKEKPLSVIPANVSIISGSRSIGVGIQLTETGSEMDPRLRGDDNLDDILKLKEKWTFVLETIRPFNFSLEVLLRSINIADCSESTIIMEVPYSFHQRILEAPKNRDLLESVFSDILGRSIHISTVLGKRADKSKDIVNIEAAADDEIIRAAAEIFNSDPVN